GNGFLSAIKITGGLISGSFALLGDGIDSATDIITSVVTLITSKIADQPPDEGHPYGHGRAETVATKALSFIIFFAGAQLALTTVKKLFESSEGRVPDFFAIYIVIISIFGKAFLAYYKYRAGKKVNSSMLLADAKNMMNDILMSISVLIGLLFTLILNMPIVDIITALLISIWIMKVAFDIFLETTVELMDGLADQSIYNEVFNAACGIAGVRNPHRTRIRKINTMYIIDMDIEVDGTLTVEEGHEISKQVHNCIQNKIENIYDVIIHVEPIGNKEEKEKFGLSKDSIIPDE
ncbi:MAG: cation diffusion facilitator family transporter, partial [Spirochaetota bacterium]|nr:cation diffusion facilitator family transporter [Spirochaetota bacterium]